MPTFNVKVKWGREIYPVEVNTDEGPTEFKAILLSLTGVSPARQKVMVKGKTLADDSWANFPAITEGMTLLLMGSKEEDISAPPAQKIKFVEDMNDSELATALELPMGLVNLGNTCYLNATVQCLKTAPPLTDTLKSFTSPSAPGDSSLAITTALRDLYNTMDRKISIPPLILLQAVHTAFPRFAERGEHGVWAQQDANECWTELVRMLQQKLKPKESESKFNSVIDQYFGGKLVVDWKNNEAPEEVTAPTQETFLQLSCFIATETKYMHSGIKNKLEEVVTKNSPTLGRDADYTRLARIDRLPAYLTVQMVRFFYKQQGQGVNAKILKDIKFPLVFDTFDLCTKRLQEKLAPVRGKIKELEDAETERKLANKDKPKENVEKPPTTSIPYYFQDDIGSNNSGFYELQAVLTHKGRSSSSGHYVSWVKHKDEVWLKCDDDEITPVHEEDILKLSGGGDWHTAYVLLYGPKILELPEGHTMEPVLCGSSFVEAEKPQVSADAEME